jgi:N-acetylmuramoyl-L-alanine amidase
VPAVDGALDVRVVSPGANQVVPRDSTFVFGSVGSGRATLTVNGTPVPVAANGAFLAYLPVPPVGAPRYVLVAARGADTARRTVAVRVTARRPLPAAGRLVVDSGSVAPAGRLTLRRDEPVRVTVRAPRNARAWLEAPGAVLPPSAPAADADSAPARPQRAPATRVALVDANAARGLPAADRDDAGTTWVAEVPAAFLARPVDQRPRLVVARDGDTVRLALGEVRTLRGADETSDAAGRTWRTFVQLGGTGAAADTDRVVVGRPNVDGTYRYFLLPGTVVERTGDQGGYTRVRLDGQLEAWVEAGEARELPAGFAPARRVAGGARVMPAAGWVDVVLPLGDRAPYQVVERGRDVDLVLHGAVLSPEILRVEGTAADSLVGRWCTSRRPPTACASRCGCRATRTATWCSGTRRGVRWCCACAARRAWTPGARWPGSPSRSTRGTRRGARRGPRGCGRPWRCSRWPSGCGRCSRSAGPRC